MRKILIGKEVGVEEGKSITIGDQLKGLLENIPAQDAKTAVKQIMISERIKGEELILEETDYQIIQSVIDQGSKHFPAKIIAPIQQAYEEAEEVEVKEVIKK